MTPEAIAQMLHELHVHQIELEMQNDELQRTQEELDAIKSRYFELYDLAPLGYCTLNDQGQILEANLMATKLLGVTRDAAGRANFRLLHPECGSRHFLPAPQNTLIKPVNRRIASYGW